MGYRSRSLQGKLPKFIPDVPEVRADVADYLGRDPSLGRRGGRAAGGTGGPGEFDNTLVVISGDHGMPGVPGGKCNCTTSASAWHCRPLPGGKTGRIVDDFVNLMDLAPTFLEAASVESPAVMTGRSFLNVLRSDKAGQVDPAVHGWSRGASGTSPRPARTTCPIRIGRSAPPTSSTSATSPPTAGRMGRPGQSAVGRPAAEALEKNTFVAFADMDASPTKAWLVRQFAS